MGLMCSGPSAARCRCVACVYRHCQPASTSSASTATNRPTRWRMRGARSAPPPVPHEQAAAKQQQQRQRQQEAEAQRHSVRSATCPAAGPARRVAACPPACRHRAASRTCARRARDCRRCQGMCWTENRHRRSPSRAARSCPGWATAGSAQSRNPAAPSIRRRRRRSGCPRACRCDRLELGPALRAGAQERHDCPAAWLTWASAEACGNSVVRREPLVTGCGR